MNYELKYKQLCKDMKVCRKANHTDICEMCQHYVRCDNNTYLVNIEIAIEKALKNIQFEL